jgi:glutathione S-transferase
LLRIACTPTDSQAQTGEAVQVSAARRTREGVQPMIVYGSSLSPYVRKVLAFGAEKGLEIELKPTGTAPGQPSDEFIEASPLRKMPALRDGQFTLADSTAIIQYLEARFPEPELIPADPELRGKTIWFDEFSDTVLTACGAKMFYNRVVLPRFLGKPGNEEEAKKAECDELPPLLDYLERTVPEPGGFLVGGRLTLADIAIASPFANFGHLGCSRDATRHSRVYAYVDSILHRPSFATWIEREEAMLAKLAA